LSHRNVGGLCRPSGWLVMVYFVLYKVTGKGLNFEQIGVKFKF